MIYLFKLLLEKIGLISCAHEWSKWVDVGADWGQIRQRKTCVKCNKRNDRFS